MRQLTRITKDCIYRSFGYVAFLILFLFSLEMPLVASPSTFLQLESSQLSEDEWLEAFASVCRETEMGVVRSRAQTKGISGRNEKKLQNKRRELRAAFSALERAVTMTMQRDIQTEARKQILSATLSLQNTVHTPEHMGLGNIELYTAASALSSGLLFQILGNADLPKEEYRKLFSEYRSMTYLNKSTVFAVLHNEFGIQRGHFNEDTSLDQLLLRAVREQTDRSLSRRTDQAKFRPLDILGTFITEGHSLHKFHSQVMRPNVLTFSWDVMLAARLHALCLLHPNLYPDYRSRSKLPFDKLKTVAKNQLSSFQKKVLLGEYTDKIEFSQAVVRAHTELETHVRDNGSKVLRMVRNRLQEDER